VKLSVSSGALILAMLIAGDSLAGQGGQAARLITPPQDQAHGRPGFWRPSSFNRPYDPQSELSRAEFKVVTEKLRAVSEVLREFAALKSPVGELASLSEAKRAAPAHVGGAGPRPSGLSSAFDRKSQALLACNPEFYDRTLPRTSLQIAVIETYPAELTSGSFSVQKVRELIDTADWKRIASLLD